MAGWIPMALRPILGHDFEDITDVTLKKLIGMGEDDSLDFKRDFPSASDKDKRELVLDIAQFANGAGGLLVYGIDEHQGQAAKLSPLVPDPNRKEPALWVDQTVAKNIAPPPPIHTSQIPVPEGFVFLIAVPPSLAQPHAVVVNEALRYPVRAGSSRRNLSELEVAERYRKRFASTEARAIRCRDLHRQLGEDLPSSEVDDDRVRLWLTMTAVPDIAGHVEMRRGLAQEWESAVFGDLVDFPSFDRMESLDLRPSYQRMVLSNRTPEYPGTHGDLYLDGSSTLTTPIPMGITTQTPLGEVQLEPHGVVRSDYLVADLINFCKTAVGHSARCGAIGSLNVAVSLHMVRSDVRLLRLVLPDSHQRTDQTVPSSIPASNPTPATERSLPLDLIDGSRENLIESARLLSGDVMSYFGLPEPIQFDDDGQVKIQAFAEDHREPIRRWLETASG